jgi:hypothetical protein
VVEVYMQSSGDLQPGAVVVLVVSEQQRCPRSPQAVHTYVVVPVAVLARHRLPDAAQ